MERQNADPLDFLPSPPFDTQTFRPEEAGFYRYCVKAMTAQIVIEIDVRKESEMGGVNKEGNVRTHEEKAMAEEEKAMELMTAASEGIKDDDFQSTKEKITTLRRLLAEISQRQQQERHRLILHDSMNKQSHSRMVKGSLMETILFIAITGVQIMTIRRWFRGPVLGR